MEDKVNILDVFISRYNLHETLQRFTEALQNGERLRVAVTPVNCILWAAKDKKLKHIYNTADIVTADGVPVVWASKLLGKPVKGRVTGLDVLPEFSKIAANKAYSFFLLGAAEGVGEKLAQTLRKSSPDLNIAGVYSPPFAESYSDEENQNIINMINESGADVLWVSLTAPKQDFWIAEHFDRLNVSIAIGVGAAFDVISGNVKRSPKWMQKSGLEWFYRFSQEPKRLFYRYFIEAPRFIPLVLKQALKKPKQ